MATEQKDLVLTTGGDLRGFEEMLRRGFGMIEAFAKRMQSVKIPLAIDTVSLNTAADRALDDLQKKLDRKGVRVRIRPEGEMPSGGTGKPSPGGTPKPTPSKPEPQSGKTFAAALEEQERNLEAIREKYRGKTRAEDRELTDDLIAELMRLQSKRAEVLNAGRGLTDAAARKQYQAQKIAVEQEIALHRRAAFEKKSVQNEGAGAGAGIMGLFRRVQATGALQFAAISQSAQVISDAVNTLSEPFRMLNSEMGNIGALGVKNLGELQSAIVGFSKSMPDTADAIAAAIGEGIGSGVIEVNEKGQASIASALAFAKTAGSLAIAGNAAIGQSVSGLAGVLNAYGLQATEADRISDVMFNTFNLGVTSVGDLSTYLSQVTPVAAAAGVSFEQIAAGVATMTKQGQKTSDVTVKLRNFLVELQKPGAALKPILDKAGVSVERIASGELTLQSAAQRIHTTLTSLGKSAPQVFSSIEAAGVVLGLSGKNAQVALEDLEGIAKRGTVAEGFAVQSQTAEVKMKTLLNNVKAGFIGFFDTVGTGVTSALSAMAQIGPTFATLASVKTILPPGMFSGLTGGIKSIAGAVLGSLIPGFAAARASGASMWVAVSGPILPIIAGIAAVVGLFVLLYNTSDKFKRVADNIFTGIVEGAKQLWAIIQPLIAEIGGLIVDVIVMPFEIVGEVIGGAIGIVGDFIGALTGASGSGIELRDVMMAIRLIVGSISSAIAGVRAGMASLRESVGNAFDKLKSGNVFGAIGEFISAGDKAGHAFAEAATARAREELRDMKIEGGQAAQEDHQAVEAEKKTNAQILDLRKKLHSASTAEERQRIAQQIAMIDGSLVKGEVTLKNARGENVRVLELSAEKLDEIAEKQKKINEGEDGGGERKKEIIDGLILQGQVVDETKKKLQDLQQQLANKKAIPGADTSQIEKDIADAEKKLGEGQVKLQEGLATAKLTGVFDNLPKEAQGAYVALQTQQADAVAKMEADARNSKIGSILGEATQIKGKIDAQDQLGQLVKDYESTTDAVKKAALAKAIADQVPQAASQYDDLGNVVGVNTKLVGDLAAKNRTAFSGEIPAKAKEFTDLIKQQAAGVAATRDRMVELQGKIKSTNDPKLVQQYAAEYDKLKTKLQENSRQLGENIKRGQDLGVVKGTVQQIGAQFGFSARQAKEAEIATRDIGKGARDAKVDVAGLSTAFSQMQQEANKAKQESRGAIAKMLLDLEDELKKGSAADRGRINSLRQQISEETKTGRDRVGTAKRVEEAYKKAGVVIGDEKPAKKAAIEAQNLSDALVSIERDTEKRRSEAKQRAIDDERARDRAAANQKSDDAARAASDNLTKQNEAIAQAEKQKKPVEIRVMGPDGKAVAKLIQGAANVRRALEDATTEQLKAIEEQRAADLLEVDRKFYEKQLQEEAKASQDRTQTFIDRVKEEQSLITGETESALTQRLSKQLQIISLEQAKEIDALVTADREYITRYAALQAAQERARAAKTDADRADAEAQVAVARKALADRELDMVRYDARVLMLQAKYNAERLKADAEFAQKVALAREVTQAASLSGLEREHALRIVEIRKAQREELKVILEGEEAIDDLRTAGLISAEEAERRKTAFAAARKAAGLKADAALFDADEDYRKKTLAGYEQATDFIGGMFKRLYEGIDAERKKELERELQDLQRQRERLLEDLRERRIGYRDYLKDVTRINDEEREKQKEAGQLPTNFWDALKEGALGGLKAIGESSAKQMQENAQKVGTGLKASVKEATDATGKFDIGKIFDGDNGKAALEGLRDTAINTFGVIGGKFGELAATGRATLGDFLDATALAVIQAVEGIVAANIPAIFAISIGLLGPLAGIPAAIGAIALVEGLLAVAKSGIQSRQSERGFDEGGYTGDLPEGAPAGIVHGREFVHTARETRRFRWLFERIRKGEDPVDVIRPMVARGELSEMAVSAEGILVRMSRAMTAFQNGGFGAASSAVRIMQRHPAMYVVPLHVPGQEPSYAQRRSSDDMAAAVARGSAPGVDLLAERLDRVKREVARGNMKPKDAMRIVSAFTITSRG